MELTPSADGSPNAFNAHFGEHYASNGYGALSEKLAKHIAPVWATLECRKKQSALESKPKQAATALESLDSSNKAQIYILDLCFGLGYNALLSRLFSAFESMEFSIISIEQDKHALALASKIHALDSRLATQLGSSELVRIAHNVSLQILWGDASTLLASLRTNIAPHHSHFHAFDAIYQDPFSYEKNSALWGARHFCTLASLLKDSGIITTYATRKEVIAHASQAGLMAYRYKVDPVVMARLYQLCTTLYPSTTPSSAHKRSSSIFSKRQIAITGATFRI